MSFWAEDVRPRGVAEVDEAFGDAEDRRRGVRAFAAVKQWLGHASIAQTVDTYGASLPTEAGVIGSLVVAEGPIRGSKAEGQGRASA